MFAEVPQTLGFVGGTGTVTGGDRGAGVALTFGGPLRPHQGKGPLVTRLP